MRRGRFFASLAGALFAPLAARAAVHEISTLQAPGPFYGASCITPEMLEAQQARNAAISRMYDEIHDIGYVRDRRSYAALLDDRVFRDAKRALEEMGVTDEVFRTSCL